MAQPSPVVFDKAFDKKFPAARRAAFLNHLKHLKQFA
jgi:hypothetical protein